MYQLFQDFNVSITKLLILMCQLQNYCKSIIEFPYLM